MDPTLKILRDLVATDSVNPSLVPNAVGERDVAELIAADLRTIGLDVETTDIVPGRPNVVGVLEGRAPGRVLMLCGHMDTVGVDGMREPFEPVERGGRLYGRGAQDMKGGLAAILGAARTLVNSGGLKTGRLVIAAVCDEEHASLGAEALASHWTTDGAVVTEPTDLRIAVAHQGFVWTEILTRGRSAHGSRPKEGRDAIMYMGRVLGKFEELNEALQSKSVHPLVGTASLHASTISGGRELSVYPDCAVLKLERRTVPGETEAMVLREAETILMSLKANDADFWGECRVMFGRPPHELSSDHELTCALGKVLSGRGFSADATGMSFWTDAGILGCAGIPSLLFGPGGSGLHSTEEYVNLQDVLDCRDVLVDLTRDFC